MIASGVCSFCSWISRRDLIAQAGCICLNDGAALVLNWSICALSDVCDVWGVYLSMLVGWDVKGLSWGMPGLGYKLFSTTPAGQRAERQQRGCADTRCWRKHSGAVLWLKVLIPQCRNSLLLFFYYISIISQIKTGYHCLFWTIFSRTVLMINVIVFNQISNTDN